MNQQPQTDELAGNWLTGRLINVERWKGTARSRFADYGIVLLLVALLIIGRVVYDGFYSGNNVRSILSESAPLGIVAIGETFVIIGAGFDLSVGSIYAIGATVFALVGDKHPWELAGALAVLIGLLPAATGIWASGGWARCPYR